MIYHSLTKMVPVSPAIIRKVQSTIYHLKNVQNAKEIKFIIHKHIPVINNAHKRNLIIMEMYA